MKVATGAGAFLIVLGIALLLVAGSICYLVCGTFMSEDDSIRTLAPLMILLGAPLAFEIGVAGIVSAAYGVIIVLGEAHG